MQTTLLGLGIAIILALLAALAAPHVVEWERYRSVFEDKASRVVGLQVHVKGAIEARILPTPRIRLRAVELGEPGQPPRLRAGGLEFELALGPLVRGEVRASEVHLVAPQVSIGLDAAGRIDWPSLTASFRADALSVSRLNIEDGRITLTHAASGTRVLLQKLWFNGEIRSFHGPFSGEGAFVANNELYGYRISGGRLDDDGAMRIKLGIDPTDQPLTAEIDGTLSTQRGVPQFDGALAMARPVGAALSSGRRVMNDPWTLAAKLRATPEAALLQEIEFQYGPEERALKFTATAELKLGERPRLEGVVAARQLDLDRALAAPDLTRRPPLTAVKAVADSFGTTLRLPIPAQLGIGLDSVTLGGTTMQTMRGDLSFDGKGWSVDRFEFRAPGLSQVGLSGRIDIDAQGLAFRGPANIEAADLKTLVAWLEGRSEIPPGQARMLRARGDITLANNVFAVDNLKASLDRENIEGRLTYTWAAGDRPAALEAQLSAADLDLDALLAFGDAALGGTGYEPPREVALAVNIGKATFAGVDARRVNAKLKLDTGILQIDQLSIGDVGGAAVDARGRIDELSSRPRGRLALDVDARALPGLTALVARIAPQAADPFRRVAEQLVTANLRAVLSVERAAVGGTVAKLGIDGRLGVLRVNLNGDATGDPGDMAAAGLRMNAQIDAEDARTLLTLLGIDRALAVERRAGRLTFSLNGAVNGDMQVEARLVGGGLDAAANGALRLSGDPTPSGALQIKLATADIRPLRQAMIGQAGDALPLSASASLDVAGQELAFKDLIGTIGNAALRGRLSVKLASPPAIGGEVEVDKADIATLLTTALGMPPPPAGSRSRWSPDPLAPGVFSGLDGAVTVKVAQMAITPSFEARDVKAIARFRPGELALDNVEGTAAGGRFAGELAFRRTPDGLAAHGRIELAEADATVLLAPAKKPIDGRLSMKLEVDGIGRSQQALIGSLHGGGTVTLAAGHFAGFDEAAFEAAMRVADQGGEIQAPKVLAAVGAAMENGLIPVAISNAPVTVTAGQARLASVTAPAAGGAELTLSGMLDFADGSLDARLTLLGRPGANALIRQRPELVVTLKGSPDAPNRVIDVSALTGWLTLRAADQQARRLEAIEANRREAVLSPVVRPESPALRLAPEGRSIEMLMPATAPVALSPTARGLDRLQPEVAPPTAPDEPRPEGGDQGAERAPALPAPIDIRPSRSPPRAETGAAAAQRPSPPDRSLLDLLFRPQN